MVWRRMTQEGQAWKKSHVGYREWRQGHGQEAASASVDGGNKGTVQEAGKMAVKVADTVQAVKSYVVLKQQIGNYSAYWTERRAVSVRITKLSQTPTTQIGI